MKRFLWKYFGMGICMETNNRPRKITVLLMLLVVFALTVSCTNTTKTIVKIYCISENYRENSFLVFDTIRNQRSAFNDRYNLNLVYKYQNFIQNDTGKIEIADNLWLSVHKRTTIQNINVTSFSINHGVASVYMLYARDYGIFHAEATESRFKFRLTKILKNNKIIDLTDFNNTIDSTILKLPPVPPPPIIEGY
jgi:hypothetical protein